MVSIYLSKKTSLNDFSSSALIMRLGLLRYENKTRIPAYDEFIGQNVYVLLNNTFNGNFI